MQLTEGAAVQGRSGMTYTLGRQFGSSGTGDAVFEIPGQNLAAKIYRDASAYLEQKITYMADHPVGNLEDTNGQPVVMLSWPKDVLYDGKGRFAGYIMPRNQGGVELSHVAHGCDSADAQALLPGYSRVYNVIAALNLSRAVAHLHANHCVAGDLGKNILVGPGGSVIIAGNDRFDLTDPATGTHFKCSYGSGEYLAPELQNVDLGSDRAVFTEESDRFSLAVHIFRLLMNDYHPFVGQIPGSQSSLAVSQQTENIFMGRCPYVQDYIDLQIPAGAPYLNEMVPPNLVSNFVRCFTYDPASVQSRRLDRVTAQQWSDDLYNYLLLLQPEAGLQVCPRNPTHMYAGCLPNCGLCAAEMRYQQHMAAMQGSPIPGSPLAGTAGYGQQPPRQPGPVPQTCGTIPGRAEVSTARKLLSGGMIAMISVVVAVALIAAFAVGYWNGGKTPEQGPAVMQTEPAAETAPETEPVTEPETEAAAEPETQPEETIKDSRDVLEGEWVTCHDEKFEDNNIFKLDEEIFCKALTIDYTVEITEGEPCVLWTVYARSLGSWEDIGSFLLPRGEGEETKEFILDSPMFIDAVIIWPETDEALSWNSGIDIYDVEEADIEDLFQEETEKWVPGHWADESVYINNTTAGAYMLDRELKDCSQFRLYFNAEMKYNSKCSDWAVYACDDSGWKNIGSLYLPDGQGEVEQLITLSSPMDIKGITVIPKINGSYSWSSAIGVYEAD